jgi:hypothetical protein
MRIWGVICSIELLHEFPENGGQAERGDLLQRGAESTARRLDFQGAFNQLAYGRGE